MKLKDAIVRFKVIHSRFVPKKYRFTHNFFWFKLCLDDTYDFSSSLIKVNKFGLYSFYDSDHLRLGKDTARENYIKFAKESGAEEEIVNVTIYTQLRFIGYVFNPVSFILLKDVKGKEHAIIEVGNTFNELKPYFVHNSFFNKQGFKFKTKKYFYISPFVDHDNDMEFLFVKNDNHISICINDFKEETKILQVNFTGSEDRLCSKTLLVETFKSPFVTLQFIFLIHLHAMVLLLKGVKYFKKNENIELQRGAKVWKD